MRSTSLDSRIFDVCVYAPIVTLKTGTHKINYVYVRTNNPLVKSMCTDYMHSTCVRLTDITTLFTSNVTDRSSKAVSVCRNCCYYFREKFEFEVRYWSFRNWLKLVLILLRIFGNTLAELNLPYPLSQWYIIYRRG